MPPVNRFTDRMLYAAACRHRFNIEFNHNFRRPSYSRWFPANIKTLMQQVFWAQDYAAGMGMKPTDIGGAVAKIIMRWHERVRSDAGRFISDEDASKIVECDSIVSDILPYYRKVTFDRGKVVKRNKRPVVNRRTEYKLPTFERKKLGGASKYTFVCVLDRLAVKDGVPFLTVRHFTSSSDPFAVQREQSARLDVLGLLWSASKLTGKPVRKIEFEVIRTKPPSVPQTKKCRSCSGTGSVPLNGATLTDGSKYDPTCVKCAGTGVGGMSLASCDTTARMWLDTLDSYQHLDRDLEITKAHDLLEALERRSESFVYRFFRLYDDEQIEDWLASTFELVREIEQARKRDTWRRNQHMCDSRKAPCPYRSICARSFESDEPSYKKLDEPYPGLMPWA